jgi:hypothetical protein
MQRMQQKEQMHSRQNERPRPFYVAGHRGFRLRDGSKGGGRCAAAGLLRVGQAGCVLGQVPGQVGAEDGVA